MNPDDLIALLNKALADEVERTGVSREVCEQAGLYIIQRYREGFGDRLLAPLLAAALQEARRLAGVQ